MSLVTFDSVCVYFAARRGEERLAEKKREEKRRKEKEREGHKEQREAESFHWDQNSRHASWSGNAPGIGKIPSWAPVFLCCICLYSTLFTIEIHSVHTLGH